MANIQRTDVLTFRKFGRSFIQLADPPNPTKPLELFSLYGALGAAEENLGSPTGRYRQSVSRRGDFALVGEVESPPELGTLSLAEGLPRETAAYLERLKISRQRFVAQYIISGNQDPQNTTDWDSKTIYEGVKLTSYSSEDQESIEGEDGEVFVSAEATFRHAQRVFKMQFESEAASLLTTEAVAVAVYPPYEQGIDIDDREIYILCSISTNARLIYSKDNGVTWTLQALTALTGADEPTDIAVIGDYLMITSAVGQQYLWATRDDVTSWTAVASGFIAASGPNAIYALSPQEIFLVGNGGYIYKVPKIGQPAQVVSAGSLTVQALTCIHGRDNVLVAGGGSNAWLISTNGGKSWSLVVGPSVGNALNTIFVVDKSLIWVGAADGSLYFTEDEGVNWQSATLPIASLTQVDSVIFSTELASVGYAAVRTAGAAYVLRTTDGGYEWENTSLTQLPAANVINDLAISGPNTLIAVGLTGSAGIAAFAQAATA